jgi:hypothetical protein
MVFSCAVSIVPILSLYCGNSHVELPVSLPSHVHCMDVDGEMLLLTERKSEDLVAYVQIVSIINKS